MATPTFGELCKKTYKEQAIWFLNGFWTEGARENTEHVWKVHDTFVEFDTKKASGNELNEFDSHRILEKYDETLSAIKMREALREIDQDNNKHMSLIEYLIWRYKKSVQACVNSPQGDNQEEIDACQAQLDEVQAALDDVLAKLEAQKAAAAANAAALSAQQKAVAANKAAAAANAEKVAANDRKVAEQKVAVQQAEAAVAVAKAAEDEVRSAEAELQAALAELKAQEDAYNNKVAELEAKSSDTSIGVVTRNKAANELAQLKGEDPLPLRKAKITQEAALRRVQKARAAAEVATAEADAKKQALEVVQRQLEAVQAELEETQRQLEESQRQLEQKQRELEATQRKLEAAVAELDQALAELEEKMAEAQAALEVAKAKPGVAHGFFWWSGRTMYRADESLPRAKQKFDHSKPFQYDENGK